MPNYSLFRSKVSMRELVFMILLLLPYVRSLGRQLPCFATRTATNAQKFPSRRATMLFSSSSTASTVGNLIARIVPSSRLDYELQKPVQHAYDDLDSLLKQLDDSALEPSASILVDDDDNDDNDIAEKAGSDDDSMTKDENIKEGDDDLTIILHATVLPPKKGPDDDDVMIHFHSSRASNENAEKGLKRLTTNFMAKFQPPPTVPRGKKRKSKQKQRAAGPVLKLPTITTIRHDGEEGEVTEIIDIKTRSNLELWRALAADPNSKTIISFPVAANKESLTLDLELISCPPTVFSVESFCQFEQAVFVGVPLHVAVQTIHSNDFSIAWFVDGTVVKQGSNDFYIPTANDVGKKIQVLISPTSTSRNDGNREAYEFVHAVEPLPVMPIVHSLRQEMTTEPRDERLLRVVTYNLLADQYTKQQDKNQASSYCSPANLHRNRRMPLLIYELLAYKADILCLQEVDCYIFESLYRPVLESQGYQGFFTGKSSGQQEGCAMFWLASKLDCDEKAEVGIKDLLPDSSDETEDDGHWKEHLPLYEQLPRIKSRMQDLGQILQCVTLKTNEAQPQKVIVANTHLYYHPLGDHFRALQAYGVCRYLHSKVHAASENDDDCGIVLCGDLNSDPKAGAIQLMQQRQLDASHDCVWKYLLIHPKPRSSGKRSKQLSPSEQHEADVAIMASIPTLTLPDSFPVLVSSSGDDVPVFTHCIPQFCATLDYILSSLTCVASAPTPLVPTFMPNEGMPSDHISLVADYEFGKMPSSD